MASTMFDFPQPLGPTMEVIGSGKESDVLSTNDLNPQMSIFLIFKNASAVKNAATLRYVYRHGGRIPCSTRKKHL
jgi:hypothetical protein